VNKKTALKLGVSVGITFFVAVVSLSLTNTKIYQVLELKALDLRFVLKGNKASLLPVVHIDIDDQSLIRLGRWPWPREYHAKLITLLKECQAKQVLFDVLFLEPQKNNPKDDELFSKALSVSGITYLPFYFSQDQITLSPSLRTLLLKNISVTLAEAAKELRVEESALKEQFSLSKRAVMDEVAAQIMRKAPGISVEGLFQEIEQSYGWMLFPEDDDYIRDMFQKHNDSRFFVNTFGIAYPDIAGWPFGKTYSTLNVPIRDFSQYLKGSGFIDADADIDGVTRKVPLFVRYEDRILPQLTIAALIESLKVKDVLVQKNTVILRGAKRGGKVGDIVIPVDQEGCTLVNWQGKWDYSFKHIPYYLILSLQEVREQLGQASQDAPAFLKDAEASLKARLTGMVKDKICIVGLTATGTHDLRAVPLQADYPMVGLHANLIHTIVNEDFIRHKQGGVRIAIFLITALIIAVCSLAKLWKSVFLSLGYGLGYALVACWVFIQFGWWIDLVGPLGITIFGFAGVTSFRFFTEEKEKLWIKQAFSHYLSKEVINELMNDPSRLTLGGARRMLTVFFSDVRGFTTFSESHQPEEVVAMLNEILTEQVKVVFKYHGTLDKFVGDELMAFWGAPGELHRNDHALVAVRAAVEIQEKIIALQAKWLQEKKDPLKIGIGINTGDMVVGNMGSAERMDYTVIGDNVNLGARLCSAAGPGEIIISEATYEPVKDHIDAEKLEPIMVKGKAKPISIFKVKGLK